MCAVNDCLLGINEWLSKVFDDINIDKDERMSQAAIFLARAPKTQTHPWWPCKSDGSSDCLDYDKLEERVFPPSPKLVDGSTVVCLPKK